MQLGSTYYKPVHWQKTQCGQNVRSATQLVDGLRMTSDACFSLCYSKGSTKGPMDQGAKGRAEHPNNKIKQKNAWRTWNICEYINMCIVVRSGNNIQYMSCQTYSSVDLWATPIYCSRHSLVGEFSFSTAKPSPVSSLSPPRFPSAMNQNPSIRIGQSRYRTNQSESINQTQ